MRGHSRTFFALTFGIEENLPFLNIVPKRGTWTIYHTLCVWFHALLTGPWYLQWLRFPLDLDIWDVMLGCLRVGLHLQSFVGWLQQGRESD